MEASELRIGNWVRCKVSNDAGSYRVSGIDGWKRIFKSKEDEKLYNLSLDEQMKSKKTAQYHDERLIRITGGARDNDQYPESKIGGIKLTPDILLKCGFDFFKDNNSYQLNTDIGFSLWGRGAISVHSEYNEEIGNPVKFLHQLQNLYFALTNKELEFKP